MNRCVAMLLCLGEASRMKPLSLRSPKAMLPFCGRPLVKYSLEALHRHGIRDVIIVAGLQGNDFHEFQSSGNQCGMHVNIAKRGLEYGSAGVVMDVALEQLKGTEDVLVVYGDSLFSLDLERIVDAHQARKNEGCQITVAYHTPSDLIVPGKTHTNYGILWINSDQRVLRFEEKPAVGKLTSRHANSGVFVLNQTIFEQFPKKRPLDFSKDVFGQLATQKNSTIYGFDIAGGYRFDIGTLQDYVEKQFAVLNKSIPLEGVPWSLVNDTGPLPHAGRVEGRAMIGRNCRIQEGVTLVNYNVIGSRVSIGTNSVINNCVILDDAEIGNSAILTDVVIGFSGRVADGAVLGKGQSPGATINY